MAAKIVFKLMCIGFLMYSCSSNKNKQHTIQMIHENPSKYTSKKSFPLADFTVIDTRSFMNYSINVIYDTTGKMPLIYSSPLNKGQIVKGARVTYTRLYSNGEQTVEVLLDKKSIQAIATYGPLLTQAILQTVLYNVQ
ncbi:MAG: hypothetical protein ACPGU0_08405 [Marinirhabdus sp.]